MKLSIITATKNNKPGLLRAIECVRKQTYRNVEHIVVDGGSTDGSVEILRQARNDSILTTNLPTGQAGYSLLAISEPDEGIYDAINKGIKLATGDVIGLLHSDDLYADVNVIKNYASAFDQPTTNNQLQTIQAVYSDLVYVRKKQEVRGQKPKNIQSDNISIFQSFNFGIIRNWKTQNKEFTTEAQRHRALKNGWMPPHPTLFIRKEIFEKYGFYNIDLKIASDYEMILRLLFKNQITSCYLPITTYLMSIGGASNKSIGNIITKSREDYTAMKRNGIPFPLFTLLCKNFRKLPQFLARDL
jgi:glycosyltransferase